MTRLLITGCARSGTKYLATLLQHAGIDATHERYGRPHAGAVDVSSDAGLNIARAARHIPAIGHVVRHPQQVVASIVGRGMLDEGWGVNVRDAYPVMSLYHEPIDQALAYWLSHNERIERYSLLAITLPQLYVGTSLMPLLFAAGLTFDGERLAHAEWDVPQDINHRADAPPIKYDWHAHAPELRERAEQMAERYGIPMAVTA